MRKLGSIKNKLLQKSRESILYKKINNDFHQEFGLLVVLNQDNPHINYLIGELTSVVVNTRDLFEYGFKRLPKKSDRPDDNLATFFLILSELKDIPVEASSFALDLMVYCENGSDGFDSLRTDLIYKEYEDVMILLEAPHCKNITI